MEISYKRAMELGVEWRTTTDPSKNQVNVIGGSNFGGISSLAQNPFAGPSGLFLAAVDGTVKVGDKTFANIGALVHALQTKGDVDVLSTPHLLTTDNEEAEIIVSDNIPFQTSEKFDSNGQPIFTFEYRDVGLTLRFTPQINDDDFVKLKIFQEVSDIVSTTTGGTENAPSTTKRSAKTTVVAKDGSTVVIGGLIKSKRGMNQSSVPCLGDIPIMGALFRSRSDSTDKTNLMIFLTPHIIRTNEDMAKQAAKKQKQYDALREEKRLLDDPLAREEEKEKAQEKAEEKPVEAPKP
jgi:general secretion pathway protein D